HVVARKRESEGRVANVVPVIQAAAFETTVANIEVKLAILCGPRREIVESHVTAGMSDQKVICIRIQAYRYGRAGTGIQRAASSSNIQPAGGVGQTPRQRRRAGVLEGISLGGHAEWPATSALRSEAERRHDAQSFRRGRQERVE